MTCKFCNKSLRLEDLRFKEYQARRTIETCGIVTVEKKGNVITDRIQCGGMVVRGKVKGTIRSRGPGLGSPEAEIKGDITALQLAEWGGGVCGGGESVGGGERS